MLRISTTLAACAAFSLLATLVDAKGLFQAEGRISSVKRNGEEISLVFDGNIGFAYVPVTTEGASSPTKPMEFSVSGLPIVLRDWTEAHKSTVRASSPNLDALHAKLAGLATPGRVIRVSIDNPGFSFSNTGRLVKITGTYIYAVDPRALPARPGAAPGQ